MKTAKLINTLEAALKVSLNTQIEVEAEDYGKTVAAVADFSQGFEDPMRLSKYNACLICPDQVRLERSQQLCRIPVDLILAVKASGKSAVMDTMKVYADAVGNLVEADPTLGGNAFEVRFESAEFVGPTPANGLVGVVIARLSVDADDMLQ
ncbi:MAG: hypothetical protein RBT68_11640 [Spirochaetia bacterium]|jgi:hypothetical protein|nr:hypothetical protein [Spirochaetia bacterium]